MVRAEIGEGYGGVGEVGVRNPSCCLHIDLGRQPIRVASALTSGGIVKIKP